jgi:hemoglobin
VHEGKAGPRDARFSRFFDSYLGFRGAVDFRAQTFSAGVHLSRPFLLFLPSAAHDCLVSARSSAFAAASGAPMKRMPHLVRSLSALAALLTLAPLATVAVGCGGNPPPPPVEPKVVEVVADAGPELDAAPPVRALYDRLGGKEGIEAVADVFSKNLLADPRVNKSFKKTKDSLAHFKQMIAEQICQLAAGPCQYSGKDMKEAHKGMGITDAQFDALVEDLKLALDEKGATEQDKSELFAALAPMRADIVEKPDKADKGDKGEKKDKGKKK